MTTTLDSCRYLPLETTLGQYIDHGFIYFRLRTLDSYVQTTLALISY
jgi:hypothetical protein